ncbi:MAG: DUF2178 domain-containing protein [Lewinella sp.]|nr:DUF2178 domain-containing protein [Lewinella sp.]
MVKSRSLLMIMVALTVTATLGAWMYMSMETLELGAILLFAGAGLIVLGSFYIAYTRLRAERAGLPGEDELSRRVMEKASAGAFVATIWILTILIMFVVDSNLRPEHVLELAIVLIGLAWVGLWIYYHSQGIEGE